MYMFKKIHNGSSQAVLSLRLCASTSRGTGSVMGREAKMPHDVAKKLNKQVNNQKCFKKL